VSGIDVDGLRWEVRTRGAGRPLLLVHGFTGRGTSWEPHATAFARRRRVINVDLPGHGRSGIPSDPARASVERTADDLAVILGRVRAIPADIIGYSLGAPATPPTVPWPTGSSATGSRRSWTSGNASPCSPASATSRVRRPTDSARTACAIGHTAHLETPIAFRSLALTFLEEEPTA